jgi:RecB family exonuclease
MGMGTPRAAPWSFSRIKAFEQCPRKFYHLKVAKTYTEAETEAMMYGTLFHEAAEFYVRDGTPLPERFAFAQSALDSLMRKQGEKLCEYEMGLTQDLEPCGFKDDNVWWRGIADLVILDKENKLAWVIDYKTGSNTRYADTGQLELMALAAFKHFPEIETVRAGLLFVVAKELIKDNYKKEDAPVMWKKWLSDYSRMELAFSKDVWNAHPSGLCRRHCPVTECPHNGANS